MVNRQNKLVWSLISLFVLFTFESETEVRLVLPLNEELGVGSVESHAELFSVFDLDVVEVPGHLNLTFLNFLLKTTLQLNVFTLIFDLGQKQFA
jgi:hypothetical protein